MTTFIKPAAGAISAGFGPRKAPTSGASTFHFGTDIGANNGSPVCASAAGVVSFAGLAGGFGGLVRINHPNGDETYYAHLSYIGVRYGQGVAQGQVIGASGGRKGQWGAGTSTGSHLHTEHHVRNVGAVNPASYWVAATASDSTPIILERKKKSMYLIHQAIDGVGSYLVTDNGVEGITATQEEVLFRVLGKPDPAFVYLAGSEIAALDALLRTGARRNAGTASVDPAAIAAALAPLLKTSGATGITVAEIEAALADDFANLPAATRAAIIK